MSTNQTVSKVWSFCNTLRDDGVGYGDYLEQLTYLLFLKPSAENLSPQNENEEPASVLETLMERVQSVMKTN